MDAADHEEEATSGTRPGQLPVRLGNEGGGQGYPGRWPSKDMPIGFGEGTLVSGAIGWRWWRDGRSASAGHAQVR